ncbi:dihydroorotase [Nafulsella turpanensis]|uniref:dihydroorotase n=1 Tax=Nafulsella turpanensis TaxID=1265690 RepID=UPI00034D6FA3|nr:dihydroorotase [Nafulsella turpanensis]
MKTTLILNATIVNRGKIVEQDVYIKGPWIEQIGSDLSGRQADQVIDAQGKYLLPGVIDDQVHFREPGLTHKGDIYSESRAAVAGGITSFMEMPNTQPQTLTQELLEEKYAIAAKDSLANYSFYMGASNDNLEEVLKTDKENVCAIKVFMGSSTGNMLVDDTETLEKLFSKAGMLIATHCEDEGTIRRNAEEFRARFGEEVPMEYHPKIRSAEACYLSSSRAVELAKKHGTRLHILHISTARETELFRNDIPLKDKKITAEACIHHLWFEESQYTEKGSFIKWNPAVKSAEDRAAIRQAVKDGRIDVMATDHAPHTLQEKQNTYFKAPSGGPLVQHSLVAALELHKQGVFSLDELVEKMCHNPAILFNIRKRGYIEEGFYADLVLVDLNRPWTVSRQNILYKCGWSPFEGQSFQSYVTHTFVSGHLAWAEGAFREEKKGERLQFDPR